MAAKTANALGIPEHPRRARQAERLKTLLDTIFAGLPAERAAQLKVARMQEKFAEAVIAVFGEEEAVLILENIQGLALVKDKAPRKASATGDVPVFLYVYTTQAGVKAELDGWQERLKWHLWREGVRFDRLKPMTSTHGMRERPSPFAGTVGELRAKLSADAPSEAEKPVAESEWTPERIAEAVAPLRDDNPKLADAIARAMESSLLER